MQDSSQSALYRRGARLLVQLYPSGWRERYGEEMLMTLEDSPPTLKTLFNLSFHLFDAYLHRNLIPGRTPHMLQKMRFNELTIYGATLIFSVAFLICFFYHKLLAESIRTTDFRYTPPPLLENGIYAVFALLALLILFGGLPILFATCREALKTHNRNALLFCFLGIISPIITVGLTLLALSFGRNSASSWISLCIFFSGLGFSLLFIFLAVRSIDPSRRVTHYALSLATLVPPVMFAGLVVLLLWMLPFYIHDYIFMYTFMIDRGASYIIRDGFLTLVMIAALSLSVTALIKGFQAKRASQVAS